VAPTTTRPEAAFPDADVLTASDLAAREVAVEVTRLEAAAVLPVVVAALRLPTHEEVSRSVLCGFENPCFAEAYN
jgi:hypothetical protein